MNTRLASLLTGWTELPTAHGRSFVVDKLATVISGTIPEAYISFLSIYGGGEGPIGEQGYARFWSIDELEKYNTFYNCREFLPNIFLIGSDGGSEGFGILHNGDDNVFVSVPLCNLSCNELIQSSHDFIEFLSSIGENLL
jgi:hypothetical protein